MKIKRLWQGLLLMLVTGVFYNQSAIAEPAWYTCTIDSVGTRVIKKGKKRIAQPLVQLDDVGGAFTDTEFSFNNKAEKEMLATTLTAVSNGFQIEVFVDLLSGKNPLVIDEVHLLVSP